MPKIQEDVQHIQDPLFLEFNSKIKLVDQLHNNLKNWWFYLFKISKQVSITISMMKYSTLKDS